MCAKVVPPPGTIPSSTAALVAFTASSSLNLRSFISVSVAAPTLIRATPPLNLAKRSCNFSFSYVESLVSNWRRNCSHRANTAFLFASEIIVVDSFPTITRRASPNISSSTFSNVNPASPLTTCPPVKTARSASNAFRRSAKPGARTATTFKMPRILLIINVAKASFSTLSLMISRGRLVLVINSRVGNKSCLTRVIFLSVIRTKALSNTTSIRSWFVTK